MPYASDRNYLDADSHLMERPDFLRDFATAEIRDRLEPIDGGTQDKNTEDWHQTIAEPGHSDQKVAQMLALASTLAIS
ncbi:MAG: hypothetical protein AAF441_11330 [Pseudomonadota bacterium]